jgi:carboxymethylenebutenolidase
MAIEKVALESVDVFVARPPGTGPFPAVILFTEGLGLNRDMLEGGIGLLAQHGFVGIAPDFYHGVVFDGTDREAMIAKISSLNDVTIMDETRQAIDYARGLDNVASEAIGGIGFCMGGRLGFLAHAEHGLRATVCFYGGGIAPATDRLGRKPLLDRIPEMTGALMLGYGAEDGGITGDEHGRIVEALSLAQKRFEFHLFTNAGHAFLAESRASMYRPEAAAEAWPLAFGFLHRFLS